MLFWPCFFHKPYCPVYLACSSWLRETPVYFLDHFFTTKAHFSERGETQFIPTAQNCFEWGRWEKREIWGSFPEVTANLEAEKVCILRCMSVFVKFECCIHHSWKINWLLLDLFEVLAPLWCLWVSVLVGQKYLHWLSSAFIWWHIITLQSIRYRIVTKLFTTLDNTIPFQWRTLEC